MLANNGRTGKKSQSGRRMNLTTSSSSTDDDVSIPNNIYSISSSASAVVAVENLKRRSPLKKTKFWKLQEDTTEDCTDYIPPPRFDLGLEEPPADPFDGNTENSIAPSDGRPRHKENKRTLPIRKVQNMTFQRLDSTEEGSNISNYNISNPKQLQNLLDNEIHDQTVSLKSFDSTKHSFRASKTASSTTNARSQPKTQSDGKNKNIESATKTQNERKQTRYHQASFKYKTPNRKILDDSSRTENASSFASSGSFGGYQPPSNTFSEHNLSGNLDRPLQKSTYSKETTIHAIPKLPVDKQKEPPRTKNGFLLEAIRHSASEETFDVRTSHSSNRMNDKRHLQRSDSEGSQSQSGFFSESGFPSADGGHDFRQIVFDEKTAKVAVSKSDTGSGDFSDFVKAASTLTKNLSKDIMGRTSNSANQKATHNLCTPQQTKPNSTSVPLVDWPTLDATQRRRDVPSCNFAGRNESNGKFAAFMIDSKGYKAPGDISEEVYSHGVDFSGLRSRHFQENIVDNEDDCGFSVSSNQSTQKSRNEFQAGIRTRHRVQLPNQKDHCGLKKSFLKMSPTTTNEIQSVNSSAVSASNATFSKKTAHFSSSSVQKPQNDQNSFFDGAAFGSKELDPFHIGDGFAMSNDSTWDIATNPFNEMDGCKSGDMDQAITGLSKATSLDEGLIASIRKASFDRNRQGKFLDSSKRDPSPRAVQPSNSDSVLEYSHNAPLRYRSTGPLKNPPKAVPSNAILGSMLFRQTQSIHSSDEEYKSRKKSTGQKDDEIASAVEPKQKETFNREISYDSAMGDRGVPKAVHADEEAESIVSSVTEEASSFYNKSFGGNSAHWNRQAQSVLNHYNVKRTLQTRDGNTYNKVHRHQNSTRGADQYMYHSNLHQQPTTLMRVNDDRTQNTHSEA